MGSGIEPERRHKAFGFLHAALGKLDQQYADTAWFERTKDVAAVLKEIRPTLLAAENCLKNPDGEHWDELVPLLQIETRLRSLERPELDGLISDITNARTSIADL